MERRQPERTCVGCRSRASKQDLVRVVRTPAGEVRMDATGREAGRGAYLHRSEECVRLAARRGALARALKAPLEPSEAARLMEQIRTTVGETTR